MSPPAASIVELPSPFRRDEGRVKVLEPRDCNRARLREALLTGAYRKPFIVEDRDTRALHFTRDFIQSAMRLDDPWALEFAYTRKMMGFLLFTQEPREVLVLGLGGGSLVKYCHRHLPAARITVVEIDPHVVAFRDEFRVPPDDARLTVVIDDAAAYVARRPGAADVILMDAFDREGFAPSVATRDFYADAREALARRGVLVVNLVGATRERVAHLERIRATFDDNVILVPVEDDGNHIAFAFRDARFEPRWRWMAAQARAMRERYGLDFPRFAGAFERSRKLGYLERTLRSRHLADRLPR
jgi:spermidine synthase